MKDLLIIEGLERRDKVVFDYIFNYYYSTLCAFSMQYFDNRNSVEDLVQDFLVYLWLEAPRLKIRSSLKSYLFAAIKNRCLDYQKHHKIAEKYRNFILFSAEKEDDSTEHFFAESELRQAIQTSLGKLPPRCREIFEYSRLHGLSNQEFSDKLNISKRTVELQIKLFNPEARKMLILSENSTSEQNNRVLLDTLFRSSGFEPEYTLVNEFAEWKTAFIAANQTFDLIYLPTNGSIKNWDNAEAVETVSQNIKVPVITCDDFMMPYCVFGMTKVASEQGEWAAKTALEILNGKSIGEIPLTRNIQSKVYLNQELAAKIGFTWNDNLNYQNYE